MNKTLTFFTAPITALFYPPVYQDAAKSHASRGVLYSLYLAALSVVLVMMVLSAKVMPQVDTFAVWAQKNMPVMIWTPAGLSMENGKTTASLIHPQYGAIAIFDMTKTVVTPADMGKAYIFVTPQKIFIKRAPGQLEERDVTGAGLNPKQQLPPKVRLTGEVVSKLYQNVKRAIMFALPFLMMIFFFIFFLMSNLLYSLAGLLFNLMRVEKLRYGAIFNLTCFATTAAFTLTYLRVLTPLRALSWPFVFNILLNLAFMFFAFKVTDKKPAQV